MIDADIGALGPGQVLVGLRMLGLNAGLASRLGGAGTSYGPGIGVGDVPASDAVVEVLESHDEAVPVGTLAVTMMPWRTAAVVSASALRPIDASTHELAAHLTILGHTGFTAWTGMVHVGAVGPDDVVFVSGAAGGVGSSAVQFAKARGATVIGVAGSAPKVELLLEELGADGAFDRHNGTAVDLLREAAPNGITLYYDNVGGEQLEAALDVLTLGGRVVVCGAVAGGSLPGNFRNVIYKELTLRGFTVTEHENLRPEFEREVSGWLREGLVRSVHTIFDGIEQVPAAFESVLSGGSTGRVLVSVPVPVPVPAHEA